MAIYLNEGQDELKKTSLTDEEAGNVNGGVIHMNFEIKKLEVIDDETGKVLAQFEKDQLEDAKKYARDHGIDDMLVYTSYVEDIRRRYKFFHPEEQD
jgi:hypothetical protein